MPIHEKYTVTTRLPIKMWGVNGFNVYHVFLLRLWQEEESATGEAAPLRIVLEEPQSGERRSFASLAALMAHLENTVDRQSPEARLFPLETEP
jgi:hypothetical protein